jgi:nucleoside-diphosphate-sugar epimerase
VLAWVTGASGFVGYAVAERLVARGDDVVVYVRPSSRGRVPSGTRVVEGSLPDVSALASLPPPDVVFHCAAVIDCNDAEGRRVHVDGTLALADAAHGARFVHVSTTDVLPDASASPLDETSLCAPRDAYGRTKLDGERRLLAARPDAVVLRPPGIYGPRSQRDVVLHLAKRIARGTYFHVGDGNALRPWLFVENLVDALLHAATFRDLHGVYLVDDGRAVSRREMAAEIARALGKSPRFASLPVPAARVVARVLENTLPRLGMRSPLTTSGIRYATTPLTLDTTRWKSTGFRARYDLRAGVRATVAWGRATGRL